MFGDVDQGGTGRHVRQKALIAVGSNAVSDDVTPFQRVVAGLRELETRIDAPLRVSPFYNTPAFPPGAGPDFVNAACAVETDLDADDLLAMLHDIEAGAGRERHARWAPRTLDLDLLALGDTVLPDAATVERWMDLPLERQAEETPATLILPHPRMQERSFVLVPLMDVAPDWRHPLSGLSVAEMLGRRPAAERDQIRPISA